MSMKACVTGSLLAPANENSKKDIHSCYMLREMYCG